MVACLRPQLALPCSSCGTSSGKRHRALMQVGDSRRKWRSNSVCADDSHNYVGSKCRTAESII